MSDSACLTCALALSTAAHYSTDRLLKRLEKCSAACSDSHAKALGLPIYLFGAPSVESLGGVHMQIQHSCHFADRLEALYKPHACALCRGCMHVHADLCTTGRHAQLTCQPSVASPAIQFLALRAGSPLEAKAVDFTICMQSRPAQVEEVSNRHSTGGPLHCRMHAASPFVIVLLLVWGSQGASTSCANVVEGALRST